MKWPDDLKLVFLPGLDGTGLSYEPLKEKMPANTKVTIISYPLDHTLSYPELVSCAAQQLSRKKSLVILAESFSGPVAMGLLNSVPLDVKGIIFCATFAQSPHPVLLHMARYAPLSLLFRLPILKLILYTLCGGKALSEPLIPLLQRIQTLVKPNILAQRVKMIAEIDVVSYLSGLTIPCCYIQASNDKLIPADCIKPFQRALPNLLVKKVEGPHFILQTKPKECSEVIMEFINRLKTRSRARLTATAALQH